MSTHQPALLTTPAQLHALATLAQNAAWTGIDLEFWSQDRYFPEWCLLQVALPLEGELPRELEGLVRVEPTGELTQVLALVETRPMALPAHDAPSPEREALRHLVSMLATVPQVIMHAPRQDLAILATHAGVRFPRVMDTQLAACFVGMGDQVGYARLSQELLGVNLSKEQQWTDWRRRPLSTAQVGYAVDDVRHLYAMWLRLAAKLGPRSSWAAEEAAAVVDAALAAASLAPELAWRELGGLRGLSEVAARVVMATAAWRLRTARSTNRPLGHILDEKSLVEFARRCAQFRGPGSLDAYLAAQLGQLRVPVAHQASLIDEIAEYMADQGTGIPEAFVPGLPLSPRVSRWVEQLLVIAQLGADEAGIPVRLVATRADAEAFARAVDRGGLAATVSLAARQSWRRDVVGERWRQWFSGEGTLVGDMASASGVRWQAVVTQPAAPVDGALRKATASLASASAAPRASAATAGHERASSKRTAGPRDSRVARPSRKAAPAPTAPSAAGRKPRRVTAEPARVAKPKATGASKVRTVAPRAKAQAAAPRSAKKGVSTRQRKNAATTSKKQASVA